MRSDLYSNLYQTEDTHWWHKAKRIIVTSLIRAHAPTNNPVILDVGCGTGKNLEEFKSLGRVVGIDLSQTAVDYCKKRGINSVVRGSVEKLPFSANKIDIVTALDVIEHVDEQKSLSEVARVLKPGGVLICTVPAFTWLWSEWDVALHHKKRYTSSETISVIEKNGMKVVRWTYLYSFLVVPVFFIRNIKKIFRNKSQEYTSDFNLNNPIINSVLFLLARLEHLIITMYHIPFGTSVLCVAKKTTIPKSAS